MFSSCETQINLFFLFSWLTADFWHNILRCARNWLNLKAVQASHNSHLTVWKTFFCAFLYKVKQVDRLLCLIKRSLRLYRRTGAVCIVIYVMHYLHWDFYYVCYTWHWKHLIGSFTTLWVFILKKTAPLLKGRNNCYQKARFVVLQSGLKSIGDMHICFSHCFSIVFPIVCDYCMYSSVFSSSPHPPRPGEEFDSFWKTKTEQQQNRNKQLVCFLMFVQL